MENLEKKEEKPKPGKKKEVRKEEALTKISEQLERAFTKKMKALVKVVKKETKKEIKNILKEASQKIKAGATEIAEDLLKTVKTENQNIENLKKNQALIAPEPIAATPPEPVDSVESTTISAPPKATSRRKKIVISSDNKPKPQARTRTRKTPATEIGTTDATETEQA